jgi:hypothetical protein
VCLPGFWFLAWGWPIHVTVGSTSCVLAAELMLQVLQNYQGTLLVQSPYTTAFYMHVNHIINRCFNWCIRPAQRTFLQCPVLNKYVCLFSTVWTAQNRRLFLNCADVTTASSVHCQLKFPKNEWSQVWTVLRMQNSHTILLGSLVQVWHSNSLLGLSPSYILKHNTFQAQVWPHFKACFLQNNYHMTIIYTVTKPD